MITYSLRVCLATWKWVESGQKIQRWAKNYKVGWLSIFELFGLRKWVESRWRVKGATSGLLSFRLSKNCQKSIKSEASWKSNIFNHNPAPPTFDLTFTSTFPSLLLSPLSPATSCHYLYLSHQYSLMQTLANI